MHNFGSLLDTLKEFVTDSIVDKKKYDKKVLKSVFKLLRENAVLNTQFKLYDGFTDFHSEDDFTISEYITESINTIKPFSAKQLKEANSLFKSEFYLPFIFLICFLKWVLILPSDIFFLISFDGNNELQLVFIL